MRFTITDLLVPLTWDGSGIFNRRETEFTVQAGGMVYLISGHKAGTVKIIRQ